MHCVHHHRFVDARLREAEFHPFLQLRSLNGFWAVYWKSQSVERFSNAVASFLRDYDPFLGAFKAFPKPQICALADIPAREDDDLKSDARLCQIERHNSEDGCDGRIAVDFPELGEASCESQPKSPSSIHNLER